MPANTAKSMMLKILERMGYGVDDQNTDLVARVAKLTRERDDFKHESHVRHLVQVNMIRYFVQNHRNGAVSIQPGEVAYDRPNLDAILSTQLIEEDFAIFGIFQDDRDVVLDLGANVGYAISSIFKSGCRAAVLSFEPNPLHRPILSQFRDRFPERCDFLPFGVGEADQVLRFYTPVIEGVGRDTLATASPALSLDWGIPENIVIDCMTRFRNVASPRIQFCEEEWFVRPLDTLLATEDVRIPTDRIVAMKIDVESHEEQALLGARQTIQAHRPLIMIEGANRNPGVDRLLRGVGYIYADFSDGKLLITDQHSVRVNGFYLHRDRLNEYSARGILHSST